MKKTGFKGKKRRVFLFIFLSFIAADMVHARNTFHDVSVREAVNTKNGKEKLLDVPFFMSGQDHPAVAEDLGIYKSNKRSGRGPGDIEKCQVAFLSAIISLQNRAQKLGGDAVIDIKSITKHNNLDSPDRFRCVAGALMANVALVGRVVKYSK